MWLLHPFRLYCLVVDVLVVYCLVVAVLLQLRYRLPLPMVAITLLTLSDTANPVRRGRRRQRPLYRLAAAAVLLTMLLMYCLTAIVMLLLLLQCHFKPVPCAPTS